MVRVDGNPAAGVLDGVGPLAKDPFDDAAAVQAMYDAGGILTHGRLPENIDTNARKNLGLPDPRDLASKGQVPASGIDIDGFVYQQGGYSATKGTPPGPDAPADDQPRRERLLHEPGRAAQSMPDDQQAWHSITSCKAPCNKGSGIGYPLADGPVKFDSGQLGYGTEFSSEVTTGSNEYKTPELDRPGHLHLLLPDPPVHARLGSSRVAPRYARGVGGPAR